MSQYNPVLDEPGRKQNWCGRTSASMIYNYYQAVAGLGPESYIRNSRTAQELVYPDGAVAAPVYTNTEPLNKAIPKPNAWLRKELYPEAERSGPQPPSLETRLRVMRPIFESLTCNNPVLFYSGISSSPQDPTHIVVIAGFEFKSDGEVWLKIVDPATMRANGKIDPLGKTNVIVEVEGDWNLIAAEYWISSAVLFSPNRLSQNANDLWCDNFQSSEATHFQVYYSLEPTPPVCAESEGDGFYVPVAKLGETSTPMAEYARNETGQGGFYALGLNRGLHGGVHLLPRPGEGKCVQAPFPGEVVAVRFPALNPDADLKPVHAFLGGHSGMLLLRHRLQLLSASADSSATPSPDGEPLVFYSLYLHLTPPQGTELTAWRQVAWYQALAAGKNGWAVSYGQGGPMQLLTLAEPTDAQASEVKVESSDGTTKSLALRDAEGQVVGAVLPAPDGLKQGFDALQKGALVTFSQPWLSVDAGEAIGHVGPISGGVGLPSSLPSTPSETFETGFLHWEVFTPSDSETFERLAGKVGADSFLKRVEEKQGAQDNYFEFDELKTLLQMALPAGEGQALLSTLDTAHQDKTYTPEELGKAYLQSTRFAEGTRDDFGTRKPTTYPVTVKLKLPEGFSGEAGKTYSLEATFYRGRGAARVSLGKGVKTGLLSSLNQPLVAHVPAEATQIEFACPDLHLRLVMPTGPQDSSLQQALLPYRFRGAELQHVNDMTEAGIEKLLGKLKQEKRAPANLDMTPLKIAGFWGRAAYPGDPFGEKPIPPEEGSAQSLFGGSEGQLAADARLKNLHPVTAAWWISEACRKNLARFVPPTGSWSGQNSPITHFHLGLPKAGSSRVTAYLAARDRRAKGEVVIELVGENRTLVASVSIQHGVGQTTFETLLWGKWRLRLQQQPDRKPLPESAVTEVSLPKPEIFGPLLVNPHGRGQGPTDDIAMTLAFASGAPTVVLGYLRMLDPQAEAPHANSGAIPVRLERVKRECDAPGLYLIKGKASDHFTVAEYQAVGARKVARNLAHAIEALRLDTNRAITLASAHGDGLSVSLRCESDTEALNLKQRGETLFPRGVRFEAQSTGTGRARKSFLQVAVDPPMVGFDEYRATAAIDELIGDYFAQLRDTTLTKVPATFILQIGNGENFTDPTVTQQMIGHTLLEKVNLPGGDDLLEARARVVFEYPTVSIGRPQVRLAKPKSRRATHEYDAVIMVPVHGRFEDWQRAGLEVKVMSAFQGTSVPCKFQLKQAPEHPYFEANLGDAAQFLNEKFIIDAALPNTSGGSVFYGMNLKIMPEHREIEIVPSMNELQIVRAKDRVKFITHPAFITNEGIPGVLEIANKDLAQEAKDHILSQIQYAIHSGPFPLVYFNTHFASVPESGLPTGNNVVFRLICPTDKQFLNLPIKLSKDETY